MALRALDLGTRASRLSAWTVALVAVALVAGAASAAAIDLDTPSRAPLTRSSTGVLVVELADGTEASVAVAAVGESFSMARHGRVVVEVRPGVYNVTVASGAQAVWAEVELDGVVELRAYRQGGTLHMQEMGGGHHMGMEGGTQHGMGGGTMGGHRMGP